MMLRRLSLLCLCAAACVADVGGSARDEDAAEEGGEGGEGGEDGPGGRAAGGSGGKPRAGGRAGGSAGTGGQPQDDDAGEDGGQGGQDVTGGAAAGRSGSGGAGGGGRGGSGGGCSASAGRSGTCSGGGRGGTAGSGQGGQGGQGGRGGSGQGGTQASGGSTNTTGGATGSDGPRAGNPNGTCVVPTEARAEDVSAPRTVVGSGTPASCTSDAFVNAVAKGGVITFNCGSAPKTIVLDRTAKIVNDTGPKIVIDGGGKITLSGGGKVRILYQNTCDEAQKWTTAQCDNQDSPALTVQNITFVDGNAKGETKDGGGGGAIFVRGGRFKAINTRFFRNVCDDTGQDLGGAAVRVLDQFQGKPAYIVSSTFGGMDGYGNTCSNGGGLSSIGVSFTVLNSVFSHNRAIGNGANPARAGTPGGGSGGAIYNDGNTYTLTVCGTLINNNNAREGGGAIFYVSNDRTGSMVLRDSALSANPSQGFETNGFPGIFVLAKEPPQVVNTPITR